MGPPTMPGPRAPYHLNPALSSLQEKKQETLRKVVDIYTVAYSFSQKHIVLPASTLRKYISKMQKMTTTSLVYDWIWPFQLLLNEIF